MEIGVKKRINKFEFTIDFSKKELEHVLGTTDIEGKRIGFKGEAATGIVVFPTTDRDRSTRAPQKMEPTKQFSDRAARIWVNPATVAVISQFMNSQRISVKLESNREIHIAPLFDIWQAKSGGTGDAKLDKINEALATQPIAPIPQEPPSPVKPEIAPDTAWYWPPATPGSKTPMEKELFKMQRKNFRRLVQLVGEVNRAIRGAGEVRLEVRTEGQFDMPQILVMQAYRPGVLPKAQPRETGNSSAPSNNDAADNEEETNGAQENRNANFRYPTVRYANGGTNGHA